MWVATSEFFGDLLNFFQSFSLVMFNIFQLKIQPFHFTIALTRHVTCIDCLVREAMCEFALSNAISGSPSLRVTGTVVRD